MFSGSHKDALWNDFSFVVSTNLGVKPKEDGGLYYCLSQFAITRYYRRQCLPLYFVTFAPALLQCLLFIYFFCCECVLTIEEVIVSCRYSTSAWFSIRQSQISHKVNLWVNWDNIIISIAILTVTFLLSGMPGPKLLGKARRILRSACKRNHTNTRHKSSN